MTRFGEVMSFVLSSFRVKDTLDNTSTPVFSVSTPLLCFFPRHVNFLQILSKGVNPGHNSALQSIANITIDSYGLTLNAKLLCSQSSILASVFRMHCQLRRSLFDSLCRSYCYFKSNFLMQKGKFTYNANIKTV